MPFESPDWPLEELLVDIGKGKIQLPDFQREWKWEATRIAGLLASISLGFPVGVLMMLENGGHEVNFATRPLAGATAGQKEPAQLLLDGQQRLTSLFQSLFSDEPVDTKDGRGAKQRVWFYLDIDKCLDEKSDREDEAILVVPEDKKIRSDFGRKIDHDYSSSELECAAGVFPLSKSFDDDFVFHYYDRCTELGQDTVNRFKRFKSEVLDNIKKYLVPVIVLTKDTPKEAVCIVFEKVNTGGVPLNVFELLTATFAADGRNFRLNDDWKKRQTKMVKARPVLSSVDNTAFLQGVSLLATRQKRLDWKGGTTDAPGVSCKHKDVLRLTLDDYLCWADTLTDAFIWAGEFVNHQYVFRARDMPYQTQLVPLAVSRVVLGHEADLLGHHSMLARWYWCGVLGELYGGATETRFARDVEQVPSWVEGGEEPDTVAGASFNPTRLLTLRTRNSAAYKGLFALTMRETVMDWMLHQTLDQATFFDYKVDIHHIFPKAWCDKNGIDHERRESVNKTPLAAVTNRYISARAPSDYRPLLVTKAKSTMESLDVIMKAHLIDPADLDADNFDDFFEHRRRRLLELIEKNMGKAVLDESAPIEPEFEDVAPTLDDVAEEAESETADATL